MNPKLAIKALSHKVYTAGPGRWRVAGDSDIYEVSQSPYGPRKFCDCQAGRANRFCSHVQAVLNFIHLNSTHSNDKEQQTSCL